MGQSTKLKIAIYWFLVHNSLSALISATRNSNILIRGSSIFSWMSLRCVFSREHCSFISRNWKRKNHLGDWTQSYVAQFWWKLEFRKKYSHNNHLVCVVMEIMLFISTATASGLYFLDHLEKPFVIFVMFALHGLWWVSWLYLSRESSHFAISPWAFALFVNNNSNASFHLLVFAAKIGDFADKLAEFVWCVFFSIYRSMGIAFSISFGVFLFTWNF